MKTWKNDLKKLAWLLKRPIFGRNRNLIGSPCLLSTISLLWSQKFAVSPVYTKVTPKLYWHLTNIRMICLRLHQKWKEQVYIFLFVVNMVFHAWHGEQKKKMVVQTLTIQENISYMSKKLTREWNIFQNNLVFPPRIEKGNCCSFYKDLPIGSFHPLSFFGQLLSAEFLSKISKLRLGGIQQLWGHNFAIFWPPHPCLDGFYTISMDKNRQFLTPSPSSCPHSYWMPSNLTPCQAYWFL